MADQVEKSIFQIEFERAKKRNALIPPHSRMIVTSPTLSAHRRQSAPLRKQPEGDGS